ncbi:MAG: hypothetical protein MSC31_09425 [Solirubrobacteraceae bacterium MAG38_C4-C5]|nr:hypothetical protein [Candidatus Siliceabacter maunaloa]
MDVKDHEDLMEALDRAEASLRAATDELQHRKAAVQEEAIRASGPTVRELAARANVSEDAVVAFAETVGTLLADRSLTVPSARRAALLAVSEEVWEHELGPLLSSADVRELLGDLSRQRVDELLRARRLIGLRDSAGRRRFPAFQFRDGRALEGLVSAYWVVADVAASDWTAASWLVSPDQALGGRSPVQWVRDGHDAGRLITVARQDAARLSR